MDEDYRRYQPAILTWYETANHAFERGAEWQNMGGIENSLDMVVCIISSPNLTHVLNNSLGNSTFQLALYTDQPILPINSVRNYVANINNI